MPSFQGAAGRAYRGAGRFFAGTGKAVRRGAGTAAKGLGLAALGTGGVLAYGLHRQNVDDEKRLGQIHVPMEGTYR